MRFSILVQFLSLATGVEFFMNFFQPLLLDMGVDLGGGNVGMTEHHLNSPEIGTIGEKVGGKGMADHVRGNFLGDASL